MAHMLKPVPADAWLLPTLRALLPEASVQSLQSTEASTLWESATSSGLVREDELLEALSAHSRTSLANGLVVSSEARDAVTEQLSRRFGILPLAVSESTLDIATSNPYDIDCEKTLAFATARTVRMCLAPPDRIQERIEEVYAPVDRVSRILDKAGKATAPHAI